MIQRDDRGDIAVLRLHHGKANALDLDLLEALERELADAAARRAAIVLTGTGSIFSAGVELFSVLDGGDDYRARFLARLSTGLLRLFTCTRPVVAAVNGHAIAGGAILATACDLIIATSGPAKLGVTEVQVGVPFPAAALEIFRWRLPPAVAQQLVLTGRLVDPTTALALGLVDELAAPEQVLERALEAAHTLAAVPAETFAVTKRLLRRPTLEAIDHGDRASSEQVARLWSAPEVHAHIRAFLARTVGKRKP